MHNPSSAPFTFTSSLPTSKWPTTKILSHHVQRQLLGLALYAQEQTYLDPRPPTKLARKAINHEPCRNSKLKCDTYVFSFFLSFFSPKNKASSANRNRSSSSCVLRGHRFSLPYYYFSKTHHRHYCTLLPGCSRS